MNGIQPMLRDRSCPNEQKIEPDKVDRLKEGWTKSGNGRAKLSKRSSRKEC